MNIIKELKTADLSIDHRSYLQNTQIGNKTLVINNMNLTVTKLIAREIKGKMTGLKELSILTTSNTQSTLQSTKKRRKLLRKYKFTDQGIPEVKVQLNQDILAKSRKICRYEKY